MDDYRGQLEAVFGAMSDGVVVFDMTGAAVLVNQAAARLYGYPSVLDMRREFAHFSSVFELAQLDGTPITVAQWPMSLVMRGEPVVDCELRVRRNDTGQSWLISFSGEPVRDAKGRQTMAVIISRDITARRKSEIDLRESESRFRALADHITQLAWTADHTGWIFWYNQRWFDYTGTTLHDMQGWGWQRVHHPDHVERVTAKFQAHLASGVSWEDTFPLRGKDGRYRWFLSRAAPIRDAAGAIIHWFGTNTDITEQREAEEVLRRSNAELEQFAYVASHDLKEPLRMVSQFLSLIERRYAGVLPEEGRTFVAHATTGAVRMQGLIEDLLSYSSAGRSADRTEDFALDVLIDQVREILAAEIARSATSIIVPPLPRVRFDRTKMLQLFQNLLANAIKFRVAGVAPRVEIVVERGSGEWTFSVIDNGIGIDPAHATRVFDVFQRLHDRSEYPGTGIGLSICKRIVDQHGGRIWIESSVGHGATVRFTLPESYVLAN